MPFGPYDPEGHGIEEYRAHRVSVIVLLASDQECREKAKRDLRSLYQQGGLQVIHLPIPDFGVPSREALDDALTQTLGHLHAGRNVAIHCSAGIGRTGTFAACLARRALGLLGDEALIWIRRYIPKAVETPAQKELVRSYV